MPSKDKDLPVPKDDEPLSKSEIGETTSQPEKELTKTQINKNKIKNFEWNRFVVVTILTMIISGVWVGGFVMRMFFHWTVASAPTLDAAMLLILGYWFSTAATKDKDD